MSSTGSQSAEFPAVARSITDQQDRDVRIEQYDGDPAPLEVCYEQFDDESRAQGIPPRSAQRRTAWIEDLLEGHDVVAWDDGDAVGHAVLIPYGDGEEEEEEEEAAELAVFVRPDYQSAGIGTELVRSLLALGRREGIQRVTLVVEPSNTIAVSLYRTVGFSVTDKHRGEFAMEREL
ncbi:GNAT family N-acetyltransferase [Salinarchaeum laminariae]|uniref:GNAT family N-acetyltransferase n=1 Tax=Salinarchaeum laminariae TaxID=869888 RepID=UPI0020BF7839|nr:GNAT family N-acetyltransferase [Salinarchaeum laminariae]